MKKIVIIAILLIIAACVFGEEQISDNVPEVTTTFSTFSDIKDIDGLPQVFEFLKEFISWKHWRYWVSSIALIFIWLIFIFIHGSILDMLPESIEEKLVKKEGSYYLFWVGFSFILALCFTFDYNYLIDFFTDLDIFVIPHGALWITWVLWGSIVLLLIGAVIAVIREIAVFKLIALYTIPYQIIHGVIAVLLIFMATTVVTYLIIAAGLVLGIIIALVVGLAVITFFIKNMAGTLSNIAKGDTRDYDTKLKEMNKQYKRRSEDEKRRKENQERLNREQMKKNRGW